MSAKLLYFVRHGETEWNRLNKLQGGELDIPLNDTGKNQAILTGKYLKDYQGEKQFDLIITSPLSRTVETAKLIAKEVDYEGEIEIHETLKERLCGVMSTTDCSCTACRGKCEPRNVKVEVTEYRQQLHKIVDPIQRIYAVEQIEKELEEKYGMESFETSANKCRKIMDYIIASKYEKILIVTHSGIMKDMLRVLFNLKGAVPHAPEEHHGNCNVMHIIYDPNSPSYNGSKFVLIKESNNEHLKIEKLND